MAITSSNSTKNKLTNLELSIQISLNGLSFCILERHTKTITTLKQISFNKKLNPLELLDQLKGLFNSEITLQISFSKVHVIHDNELSTLVPKSLFNEDALADYLKFNSRILKSDYITYDHINLNESVCVYVPYININNFLYDRYGEFTFRHISSVLIESILQLEKNSESTKFYVNVSSNHFELIIVDKSKLLFYNTFEYATKEDFIYYILFTAEQLNLNPEVFNLIFIGDIDKDDEFYKIAYKYIRHVNFGNRNDSFKYSETPNSISSNFALIKSF
ncbi:DUF3822 family protein [Seonamhaeicola aphaedonensis]|uniref:Uncharacterized protein DUF3822 n=1 Tax=Seonamhaeicola aphaedonensis TaxID=1461338 RepID=A0A3D9HK86_9FLAO|nr:DUF3822 family protein [Seonamhaeicola aphaedonensis]RED49326.1 uncharacterized protein DUF3822 [Seonamhaeicola aphaedonensis]